MPNWSSNTLTIQGKKSDVIAMFAKATPKIKGDSVLYTLQSFVPMPDTYKQVDTTNSLTSFLFSKKKDMYDEHPELSDDEIEKMFSEIEQELVSVYEKAKEYQQLTYGVVGWYDWNCRNLGTKWDAIIITKEEFDNAVNACDDEDDENGCIVECCFDTAWTPPIEWLEKMIRENPALYFDMWSDEESGLKWGYEGTDGQMSNDFSESVRYELNETITNIDPDKWVVEQEYDEETAKIFIENFEDIIMNFRDSGFWSRGGNWLEEFGDYFTDTWMSIHDSEFED
jgi:hypothetical protein